MSSPLQLLNLSRRELLALTAAFALSLPAVTPRIYASDEIQYFAYLRSLWFDRDVSFENEYRYFHDRDIARAEGFHETFLELRTETGQRPNFGTIGSALLWAPFYAVGDLVARTMRAGGREVAVDGFSPPYIAAVAYGSAVYGFLAVLLSIGAARGTASSGPRTHTDAHGAHEPRTYTDAPGQSAPAGANRDSSDRAALIAGLSIWIGTPLLFYMYVAPPYSHAPSAFAVALFVTIWLRVRRSWTLHGTVALGFAAALMAMVREQDVFFALGPAADFLWSAAKYRARQTIWPMSRDLGLRAVAGVSAFAIGFLPQLVAYWSLNGYPGPSRLVTRKMSWHGPHVLEVIGSPEHGFFLWTPLAVVAIAGLVKLAARGGGDARRIGACALLMVALQIYVGGSVESWSVSGAFGQRRFVALTILLTMGLAVILRTTARPAARAAVLALAAVCVWWNVALMAQFGTQMMDRRRLELGQNAYTAFVALPRMAPGLAWRYFTDRESFYRSRHAEGEPR